MKSPVRFILTGLASAVLLAACSDAEKQDAEGASDDPAMTGALGDHIMVDPGLTGQNGAAVDAGGQGIELPPEQRSPEAIAAAKQEAAKKAGGVLQSAPEPKSGGEAQLVENSVTAAQVAESAKAASMDCTAKVEYSMSWATKMPAELSIYPRGAVQEAAGTEKDGCALRVVSFLTPVGVSDVMDFYYTQLRNAGFSADHRVEGNEHALGGSRGSQVYLINARKLDNGLTEVDLISSGK